MADTDEEQLLSHLLNDIASEDAELDAAHLEARVMASLDAGPTPERRPRTTYWVIAAALLAAVLAPILLRMRPEPAGETVRLKADTTDVIIQDKSEEPRIVVPKQSAPARTLRAARPFPAQDTIPTRLSESPLTQSPVTQSPDEFVPLMPITEQELTGSFQIVRVQMPRASLGALRSPLERPNELVEADVLLGEDGVARAIRVSTSGSVYPWRYR